MPRTVEKNRLLRQTALVLIVLNGLLLVLLYHLNHKNMMDKAYETVTSLLQFQTGIRIYIEKTVRPEVYRLQNEAILPHDYFSPELMSRTFVSRSILENYLALQPRSLSKSIFRYVSRDPLNNDNRATPKEAELLQRFESGVSSEHFEIITINGEDSLFYAIPLGPFSSDCMKCHSLPQNAPVSLVERYGTTQGYNHQVGELSGLMSITIPLTDYQKQAQKTFALLVVSTLIAFCTIFLFIRQWIIKKENQDLLLFEKNEQLHLSHQKLNYAQKMAHLGSWHWTIAIDQLTWSDEIFRIMGDEPQAYAPTFELFLAKIHPDDRDNVDQATKEAIENQTDYQVEHRIIRPNGEIRHVREQAEMTFDEEHNIIGMVGTVQDITDIIILQQKLQKLAITDELTEALNRRQLFREGEQLCKVASRYQSSFSVLFYDLDHFKSINDSYGHIVGDEVLQQVTEAVRSTLRETDILARYGGEEFCILAPETDHQQAEALAERIRINVQNHIIEPKHAPSFPFNVTISIGIAENRENETFSSVIDRADKATYQAKKNGRNCIVVD
nr:diguanylate cyclase [uncultured Desulfuromonas sp.]